MPPLGVVVPSSRSITAATGPPEAHSPEDLEREVEQRQRAEGKLHRAQDNLQIRKGSAYPSCKGLTPHEFER
jgi:hypothetical protein